MVRVAERYALTEKITVVKDISTTTDDAATDYGERIPEWATHWQGFAKVNTATSIEVYRASQTIAVCSHVLRIPWDYTSSTINERMRVTWGSKTLGIVSVVEENNERRWLLLVCQEVK